MEYLVVSLMFIVFLQTRFMELRRATLCLAVQSALIVRISSKVFGAVQTPDIFAEAAWVCIYADSLCTR